MRKQLYVLLLVLLTTVLFAQAPEWQWATQAGGSEGDLANGISTDADGNVYVTGFFEATASFGSFNLTSSGFLDIFVAKLDSNGNWLWAEKAGGSEGDLANGISTDADGNVYVTGYFEATASFGSFNLTSSGSDDIFIAKLDSNGNWLWVEKAGGSEDDLANGISTDADGNVYVTGYFRGIASFGSFNLTSSGSNDIFIAKLDSNGNWLWAEKAGGSEGDYGNGIITDTDGNVYVTGLFIATASFGSFNLTSSGEWDIFIAKLDSNGNWLWAEKAGGGSYDRGKGISTDADGDVYVTGYFGGIASFGSFNLTSSGSDDIFISKLDSNGNWLWAEKAGGSEGDYGKGIITDADGNVYVTGYFRGIASFGSFNLTSSGSKDIFVAKMDSNGNWLWAEKAGGIIHDEGRGISTDADGNVYVIGGFYATASFGSYNLTGSGFWDIFVAKLNSSVFVENEINPAVNSLSNYPNPFNPTTTISFSIPKDSKVELSIYNIKGQKVKQLISEQFSTGQHSVVWDGRDDNNLPVGSGIYFYTLKINGNSKAINKMILIK